MDIFDVIGTVEARSTNAVAYGSKEADDIIAKVRAEEKARQQKSRAKVNKRYKAVHGVDATFVDPKDLDI